MYAILALSVGIWLATVVSGVAIMHYDLKSLYQSRTRYMKVVSLAENMEQYYVETTSFPASPAALSSVPGFEHTRSLLDNWQGYGVSPTIADGVWQFNRAVLFSKNPIQGVSPASYLAANICGSGGYDTAISWCGSLQSNWFRRETRERYNDQILTERARLNRALQKLADYYNTNGTFPDHDASNNPLAANSLGTLAALASYPGAATACNGTYTFMGMPVDCGDMFDFWGGPVGYQFVSSKHIVLVSETPIFNSSGKRVVVAADFDTTLI